MIDLISDPKLLAGIHARVPRSDDARFRFDLFLTLPQVSQTRIERVQRRPFSPDLESAVISGADEFHKKWEPGVRRMACFDPASLQVNDQTLVFRAYEQTAPKFFAGRRIYDSNPSAHWKSQLKTEIPMGAFAILLAKHQDILYLLHGVRAKWTEDIGGPIQQVGVGSSEFGDTYQQNPFMYRLLREIQEETALNPEQIETNFVGVNGSLGHWRDMQATFFAKSRESIAGNMRPLSEVLGSSGITGLPEKTKRLQVLDLGQKSREHTTVFGVPIDAVGKYLHCAHSAMASYTGPHTAWLLKSGIAT